MNLAKILMSGSQDCVTTGWVALIKENKLAGTVDKTTRNGTVYCRINLKNEGVKSLYGIAVLIDQLYRNEFCGFELINVSCEKKKIWNTFFSTIIDYSKEYKYTKIFDLKIVMGQFDDDGLKESFDEHKARLSEVTNVIFMETINKRSEIKSSTQLAETTVKQTEETKREQKVSSSHKGSPAKPRTNKDHRPSHAVMDFTNGGINIYFEDVKQMHSNSPKSGQEYSNPPIASSIEEFEKMIKPNPSGRSSSSSSSTRVSNEANIAPKVPFFGDINLKAHIPGGDVNLCEFMLNNDLISDTQIFEPFCTQMLTNGITHAHIMNVNPNNNNEAQLDAEKTAVFIKKLLNTEIFSHITFQGFSKGIDSAFDCSCASLKKIEFKEVGETNEWIKKLSEFLKASTQMTSFSCDAKTEVFNLRFLSQILLNCPVLTTLNLRGVHFEADVLIEWLSEDLNHLCPGRTETLSLTLSKAKMDADQISLLNEMLPFFDEKTKGLIKLELI
jgi:hypothetical protein